MRTFEYARAATVEEATTQQRAGQQAHDDAARQGKLSLPMQVANGTRFLAGGTDLLTLMKADIVQPSQVIDIKRVSDLPRSIEERDGGLTLGALTTLSEIERSTVIQERYPALTDAVSQAATPQLRNMATIGGNLLQRPRCWYYRNSLFPCWLKGGDDCHARDGENGHHAIFGESPCVAVHPSDAASALVAYDASVRLRGPSGERIVSLADLYAEPSADRRTETTLQPDELLLEIRLPQPAAGTSSVYLKAMDRKVWAFALVGVAASVRMDGDQITAASIVVSGVAPIPWRARAAERLLTGQPVSAARIEQAAAAALEGAHPLEHNGYKVALAQSLIRRALTHLCER